MYTVILIILNSTIYYSIAYHICLTLNIFTMLITIACGMYYDEVREMLACDLLTINNNIDHTYLND